MSKLRPLFHILVIVALTAHSIVWMAQANEYRRIAEESVDTARKSNATTRECVTGWEKDQQALAECSRILHVLPCSPLMDELKKECK